MYTHTHQRYFAIDLGNKIFRMCTAKHCANDINANNLWDKDKMIAPISYKVTNQLSENVILTRLDDVYNWAKMSSVYPLLYGTACCFIEFAALIGSGFDFDRFGLIPRASPRQADLIILAGTLNMKMSQPRMRLYEQLPEPKYIIAMGACMITGGMFSADSPTVVPGADKLMPIDVYIPSYFPHPEAIIDAIVKLRKKIANESTQERDKIKQAHRFYSTTHNMKEYEGWVANSVR
jgi:NAD(P)H-quinone oxidoreductase subunit K